MSETVTWSVKVEDEVKTEIQKLLNDSGEQGKDFVQKLVTAYKINKVRESSPDAKADIEELQYHTSRVNEIYYNLTSRVDANIKGITQEYEYKLQSKQLEIDSLEDKIINLKEELNNSKLSKQAIEKVNHEQLNKINELETSKSTSEELSRQYKDKVDTLSGLVSEYKQYKDDIESVKLELQEQKELERQLTIKLDEANKEIESLKKQTQADQQQAILKLQQLDETHKVNMQTLKDKLSLECEKTQLDLDKKYQEQIQKIREDYNKQVDEHNKQVKELLNQIQQPQEKVVKKDEVKPKKSQ